MLSIAVLASTNASILKPIVSNIADLDAHISCVITSKDCGANKIAKELHIPTHILEKKESAEEFDSQLIAQLKEYNPDLILLIGYMKIIRPAVLDAFSQKIFNVHPSLLPKYAAGMDTDVHKQVLDNKDSETGATVHVVTPELDQGPIALQASTPVHQNDTVDTLKTKVQALEVDLYTTLITKYAEQKITITNTQVILHD